MECTSCHRENPEGTVYCEGCGAVLDATTTNQVQKKSGSAADQPSDNAIPSGQGIVRASDVQMRLRVLRGSSKGRSFPIEEGSNLIGRWDPDLGAFPEIDLEAEDVEAKVSRKHAVIEREGHSAVLIDNGSLNGTYINRGSRLEEGKRNELNPGDEIIIGKTFLRFEVGPFDDGGEE